jgi:ADP-ribose pyrophosphatase
LSDDKPEPAVPRVLKSGRPFTGRLVRVRIDTVETATGVSVREVVEHPGAVLLLALDNDDNVFMVRQYRHPAGRVLLELPAGTIDEGESPDACAVRELREETGFQPRTLDSLGGFFLSPGYSTEYIHLYLATDLEEAPLDTGDEEDLRALRIPFAEALRRVDAGEICDAKSIAALLFYARPRQST